MELAEFSLNELNLENIPLRLKMRFFKQILSAIKFVHSKDIIHRDLKPKNILIKGQTIKIIDFGIAFVEGEERVTFTNERTGSMFYMAPELEDGRIDDPDCRIDIYALGKILYYLISNGVEFNREKFLETEFNLIKKYNDIRYDSYNLLFQKTICKNREERCSDLDKLIDEFEKCIMDFEIQPITIKFSIEVPGTSGVYGPISSDLEYLKERRSELFEILSDFNSIYYCTKEEAYGDMHYLEIIFFNIDLDVFETFEFESWDYSISESYYEDYSRFAIEYYKKALKIHVKEAVDNLNSENQINKSEARKLIYEVYKSRMKGDKKFWENLNKLVKYVNKSH